jgi:hypothetical protein
MAKNNGYLLYWRELQKIHGATNKQNLTRPVAQYDRVSHGFSTVSGAHPQW